MLLESNLKAVFLNHSLLFNYLKILKHDAQVGHKLSSILSQNVTQKKSVVFPPQTLLSLPTRRYHKLASPKWSTRHTTTQPILQIIKMEVLPFPQLTQILWSLFPQRLGQKSISSSQDCVQTQSRMLSDTWQITAECHSGSGQTLPRLWKELTHVRILGLDHLIRWLSWSAGKLRNFWRKL